MIPLLATASASVPLGFEECMYGFLQTCECPKLPAELQFKWGNASSGTALWYYQRRLAAQWGMSAWEGGGVLPNRRANPGYDFDMRPSGWVVGTPAAENGKSEVYFVDSVNGGGIAETFFTYDPPPPGSDTCVLKEVDITVQYRATSWDEQHVPSDRGSVVNGVHDPLMASTFAHEMHHVMRIEHPGGFFRVNQSLWSFHWTHALYSDTPGHEFQAPDTGSTALEKQYRIGNNDYNHVREHMIAPGNLRHTGPNHVVSLFSGQYGTSAPPPIGDADSKEGWEWNHFGAGGRHEQGDLLVCQGGLIYDPNTGLPWVDDRASIVWSVGGARDDYTFNYAFYLDCPDHIPEPFCADARHDFEIYTGSVTTRRETNEPSKISGQTTHGSLGFGWKPDFGQWQDNRRMRIVATIEPESDWILDDNTVKGQRGVLLVPEIECGPDAIPDILQQETQ